MTNVLSEKDYQKFLLERLSQDNGYVIAGSPLTGKCYSNS